MLAYLYIAIKGYIIWIFFAYLYIAIRRFRRRMMESKAYIAFM
jgi:hypothetical protein